MLQVNFIEDGKFELILSDEELSNVRRKASEFSVTDTEYIKTSLLTAASSAE